MDVITRMNMISRVKKERPADGWPWEVSPNRPFFFYDSEGDGFTYYATEEERDAAAHDAIQDYLDDDWNESVTNIVAGKLTHTTEQYDVKYKPPAHELDEDGLDNEGHCWDSHDIICNYGLQPISGGK